MSNRSVLVSCSALLCVLATAVAGAQGAAPANEGSEAQLEEVVVTAQKRTENLQSLSQTVTAVSGDDVLRQGVKDITDLSRVAPEVSVTTGQLNNIAIRGVRTGSFGPTLDSANAVYQDGNYNARFTSLNGLFFDIERIEVLDGPQGTLYGRNSAGGAINIISAKPNQTYGGFGSVEFGNYRALQINGALNMPISSTLALRVAYMRSSRNGFMVDSGTDALDIQGGRAQLLWTPTENDSLLLSAQQSTLGGKGNGGSTITAVLKDPTILTNTTTGNVLQYNQACPAGNTCTSRVVPIRVTDDPRHNDVLVGDANLQFVSTKNDAFALQYDHTFGEFAVLTVQGSKMSSYSKNSSGAVSGLDQDPLLIASSLFLAGGGRTGFGSPNFVDDDWDSQEVRLTSISTTPLKWVAGLYRFHENGSGGNPTFTTSPVTSVASAGGLIFPAGSPVVSTDIPNLLNEDVAKSAFGQATWTPESFERLHVTGGVRYNSEHKHGIITISPTSGPIAKAAFGPTGIFDQAKTWTATTYKANIAYDLTDTSMVYVDRSTGFQSGGYGYGSSPAYEPTSIWAWEIGTKNRFLDNRLQVNASAWYYKYSNQTANVSDVFLVNFAPPPVPAVPFNFITVANAGTSIIRGQNVDVEWNLTQDTRLGVNVQHVDAVYTDFNLTQRYLNNAAKFGLPFAALYAGYSPTGDQSGPSFNYDGTQVGGSPKIAVFSTLEHTLHSNDFDYTAQLAYRYNGKSRNGNFAAPNMPPYDDFANLPAYSTVDLTLTAASSDGKYSVSAFARNLTDKLYLTGRGYGNNSAALTPANSFYALITESYGPPRTYGVTLRARF
jgi:iron complex outermembrane recepter protein